MCKMLLSINPEHVRNILSGIKKYEYRKVRCRSQIDGILLYATYPIMKVVGEGSGISILEDTPDRIWDRTADYAGIDRDFFDEYYSDKELAVAYSLGEIIEYSEPRKLSEYGIRTAPQSFIYIR